MTQGKDRLFTPSYICILAANFLLFFGFWLIIPVLPFYLNETFDCSVSTIGAILSCYTLSALCIRPFSGYIMDNFPRKPIYLVCYVLCLCMFVGYTFVSFLAIFIVLRVVHGMAFGGVTVGGNTLCVDIMPSSRRGEGLGYYGLANNMAMALGPMTGLMLHSITTYNGIFLASFASTAIGFLCASAVKTKAKSVKKSSISNTECVTQDVEKTQISRPHPSLDRFILLKGLPASFSLLLLSIPYGTTTNYVAVYAKEICLNIPTGFFFTLMALGMSISRIVAGKRVDKGFVTECIHVGFYPVITAFLLLGLCRFIVNYDLTIAQIVFFIVPLLLGSGFGVMFPAMNSLYISLAPHNRRATATSTYLTAWDIGIGLGIVSAGIIAQHFTFFVVYLCGAVLCTISLVFFLKKVVPHYRLNRLG